MRLYWGLRALPHRSLSVRWTTSLGLSGTYALDPFSWGLRVTASMLSPCCRARLLQKTTPPTCLHCGRDWAVLCGRDEGWREFFLPATGEVSDELQAWLATPIEGLHGPLTAHVMAEALREHFDRLAELAPLAEADSEAFSAELKKLSGRIV